jgi:virginiamycin B lyase
MAAAPDGSLWVTLAASGEVVRVDPATGKVNRVYAFPAGPKSDPYAVTVDGAGIVWVSELSSDTVVRLDPARGQAQRFSLPSKGAGIRKMIVDAEGRLWYMGSHNGRLGVIE